MAKEYGGSGSGGLMDEIQALIAPPGEEKKKREGLELHPYFRRPGKGHNNDRCDSCREGGNLLCCDRCPASFHLGCHDPPVPEEDIPSGDWICHNCKATEALNLGASHSTDWQQEANEDDPACADILAVRSPLQQLIQAASLLNPKQFELPPEMVVHDLLPGEAKINQKGPGSRKRPHELDNGLVPLPAKLCFSCRKSCRVAPLMACDYCSACFHMDCLDPPMTTMPTGTVWMCPLHVENFVDSDMLKTPRLTERLRLWNHFQGTLDQDVIKTQFFRKVHRRHPPFKYKIRIENTNLVDVPEAVKCHYKNPLPRPPASVRGAAVLPDSSGAEATEEEQELWLKSLLDLQLSSAEYLHQLPTAACDHLVKQEAESDPDSSVNTLHDPGEVQSHGTDAPPAAINGDLDGHARKRCARKLDKMTDARRARTDTILKACLTDDLRRPAEEHPAELRARLEAAGAALDLDPLDPRLVRLLAAQRLAQLLGPRASSRLAPRAALDPVASAAAAVAPRATLTPLNGLGGTELVRYRSLTIGSGADNQLNLDRHGYCAFVSGRHATIFFDDMARRFELLNYSEHGTVVEGALYAGNFAARTVSGVAETPAEAAVRGVAERRSEARRAAAPDGTANSATMSKRACPERRRCRCACAAAGPPEVPRRGFETSVLLHHGSHVQFGCLRFVFAETGLRRQQESVVEALLARGRRRAASGEQRS